ncbi:MAG TPA: hypothetical protein VMM76_00160 [Pirellulaceae bacterium]|nr:hypothetical protein [Pirellulaceae bacterium]
MSLSPPDTTSESDTELREFTLWLLAVLECKCHGDEETVLVETVPASLRTKIGCDVSLRLKFSAAHAPDSDSLITLDSPIFRSLIEELKATQIVGRAAPADQPESVRDVSQRLFDAYLVEGGSVHLGGCTLEDRPLLRVTSVDRSAGTPRLKHHFMSPGGESLGMPLVESLGLRHLVPLTRSIRMSDEQCERWEHIAKTAFKDLVQAKESEFLLTTVVWCKYAEGKLAFVIGDATTSIAFSGWAQRFVDGSEKPPELACGSDPQGSRHLAATDDGAIVPFEAVVTCAESGKRVLSGDLETCQATGLKALPEFLTSCPVSGTRVLRKALVKCATCQQMVSPASADAEQCSACRSLTKVSKDDPRMARVLDEYPKLDRLPRWKLAETAAAYVLVASSLVKRLLIVIDKSDLKVLRLAKGSHFSRKWTEATEVDRAAYLQ